MASTRKRFSRGYILLESLLTLSLLAIITSVMLTEINHSQRHSKAMQQQIESLNLARMAMDKRTESLTGNGVTVNLQRNQQIFEVKNERGEEIVRLEILEVQK